MSHPCRSKPKAWPGPGLPTLFFSSQKRGSTLVNRLGKIATMMTSRMRTEAIQNSGRRRTLCHASFHMEAGGACSSTESTTPSAMSWGSAKKCSWPIRAFAGVSGIANPRVQSRVQQVHEQVGGDVHNDEQRGQRDDGGRLPPLDRLVQTATHTVDVEDTFGDDRTTHEGTEIRTEEGHHRDE